MTRALLIVAALAILATSFISLTLCGILAAVAALAVVAVGLYRYVHTDDDCGYGATPFRPSVNVVNVAPPIVINRIVHTPAVALAVIEGGKRPVWDTEIWGAPE